MSSVNNKRIAKNTFYLYLRMLLVMLISLYTVRAILDILGVVDYGIYNVVGGVVAMFAFMNRTLSTSSQRYFSVALAKGDHNGLKQLFSLNIIVFLILGMIMFALLETVGLWFVNNKMTIPSERLGAANIVYQLSIVSMLFHIVVIPYMALVIAHEKMNIFAIIGVVEAVGKLGIVFLLSFIQFDKLVVYGFLILFVSAGISMWYVIYCLRKFPESYFQWYWNKGKAIELLGFSGWHFWGTFSTTCRSSGINILLNLFFNPAVNAARAVAYQIYGAVHQLVSNFFTAVKPQIYKSYASKQYDELYLLINRSSLMSTFLISLLIFPILANTELVLGLWLKKVPEYTVVFTQLVLINGLVDSMDGPLIASALATGKIKNFMLITSGIVLANIPISYIALLLGCQPWITMCISICLSIVTVISRGYLLKGLIGFPFRNYLFVILRVAVVSALLGIICISIMYGKAHNIIQFVLISGIIMSIVVLFYAIIIPKTDRNFAINLIKNKVFHKK